MTEHDADVFTVDDLAALTACVSAAWRSAADRNWSVRAGTLDWSCARTADHAIDCVLAPAFFLASRKVDAYPDGGWSPGPDASPEQLADGLELVSRLLTGVVVAAEPDARAIIWRRPVEVRGPADFLPRGGLELILHAHDVCAGLGIELVPPADACEHLRQHTQSWPFWGGDWMPLELDGDPWTALLRASGRLT